MAKLVLVDAIILVAWSVIDPPIATSETETVKGISFEQTICKSDNGSFSMLAYVYKIVILLFGMNMAYKSRNFNHFAESKEVRRQRILTTTTITRTSKQPIQLTFASLTARDSHILRCTAERRGSCCIRLYGVPRTSHHQSADFPSRNYDEPFRFLHTKIHEEEYVSGRVPRSR